MQQAAPPPAQSYSPVTPASEIPQGTSKKRGGLKIGLIGIAVIVVAIICVVGGVILAKALLDSNSGGDGTAAVVVENDSSVAICYVLISPSSASDWGDDWLGDDETILPRSQRTFYVTSNQAIDMQLYDCDQALLDEQRTVMLDDDGITYTLEDLP